MDALRSGALVLAALLLLTGCSRKPAASEAELRAHRELAAAYFEEDRLPDAREAAQWILERAGATAQDYVNAAAIELAQVNFEGDQVDRLLDQAAELEPDLATLWYCRGMLAKLRADIARAREAYRRAMELAPDDVPSRYHYAATCADLDDRDEARRVLEGILALGIEHVGSFYISAETRLGAILLRSKDPDEQLRGRELVASAEQHRNDGWPKPQGTLLDRGFLGKVQPPEPAAPSAAGDGDAVALRFERVETALLAEAGPIRAALVTDLDGDGPSTPAMDLTITPEKLHARIAERRPDLVVAGESAAWLAIQRPGATFETRKLADGVFSRVLAGDLANHGRRSVLLIGESGARLFAPDTALGYHEVEIDLAGVRDAAFVDFDHEGDLDLLLAGTTGLTLLRNDGLVGKPGEDVPEGIAFSDITAGSGLPTDPVDWVAIEDFDADQDVDFLCGGADGTWRLVSNLRRGRFEVLDAARTGLPQGGRPELRDVLPDGLVDVIASTGVWRNAGGNRFDAVAGAAVPPSHRSGDLDLDGRLDLVGRAPTGEVTVRRGPLAGAAAGSEEALPARGIGDGPPLVADVDADGDLDLVGAAEGGGLEVWRSGLRPARPCLRVALMGRKDNRPALGAIVELRGGEHYARAFYSGMQQTFGLPRGQAPEVVRVTWPNGVVQHAILPKAGDLVVLEQKEGLVGSCPFLYVHDGERWRFVSDILGTTPLGLPMDGERFVPPDHDELVRIEGSWLRPKDGQYHLQVTEELREVTYLDRAQLWAVDHAADVEVHPEERFCFPPFPPQTVHAVRDALPIVKAVDQDGRDWTATLQVEDGEHAVPFEPLPAQYLGLVTPHALEITLPDAVRNAPRVRLLMTGWLHWTDASVNVAAGGHPAIEFVPPILEVPDADGRFALVGPPIGFPAGKTKTMVVDVTPHLRRDDPRIRLFSTIRLYWDCIRVAVDAGDHSLSVTKLEPAAARLYHRGFSRPLPPTRPHQPERFEFDALMEPRWNQHQGMLTRYGDVRELLLEIDDRFALFSSGDAVELRFEALPDPPPGSARTFLLFVDGWAKDGDPNTVHAQTVEPLPFHGMSGYPYRADEAYPEGEAIQRYRAEWNTRPGRRLIPALAPPLDDP